MSDLHLLSIDSPSLDGYVAAGDSADRTIRALWKYLNPTQRKNLVFWLGEAHKQAKQLQESSDILAFRESVQEDNRLHPLATKKTYEVNGKTYKPAASKKAPKPEPPKLTDLFGL